MKYRRLIILSSILVLLIVFKLLYPLNFSKNSGYIASDIHTKDIKQLDSTNDAATAIATGSNAPITHMATPNEVKAVYISSWVAGAPKLRDRVISIIDDTEINSIVIDVKDSTGRIGFSVNDPNLANMKTTENRIKDIRALTNLLHSKNIYIIGRVAVFQDPYLAKLKPEWAITRKSDGLVWKDRKGLSFLDPAKKEVWDYTVLIAKEAYANGFDEINFDYIRYPSDGNMKDLNYHLKEGRTRSDNLEAFFTYLHDEVKKENNIPMSADIFGLTTEVNDDMGIGQVWEKVIPHFDFVAPMVYPSHYPNGQYGFKNPAEHPYEVITHSMKGAILKTNKMQGENIHKIRPWLQDFNLGAKYTKEMVRAQIKALNDQGLTSWMLWDPRNVYTKDALELEPKL